MSHRIAKQVVSVKVLLSLRETAYNSQFFETLARSTVYTTRLHMSQDYTGTHNTKVAQCSKIYCKQDIK